MSHPHGAVFVIPLQPRKLVLPGILLAGLAALVLVQRPGNARHAPIPADPPPELRLVYPDAFFVQRVSISGLMDREPFKTLVTMLPRAIGASEEDIFVRGVGANLADLDAIATFGNAQNRILIVSTRKAAATKKVLDALAPRAAEHTYKGKVFHVGIDRWRIERPPVGDKDRAIIRDKVFLRDSKEKILDKPVDKVPPREFKDKVPEKPVDKIVDKPADRPERFFKEKDARKEGDGPRDFKDFPRDKDGPGREGPARMDPWSPAVYFLSERTYATGPARAVMAFIDTAVKPDEEHPLYDILTAAGKHHFTAGIALPDELGREMRWELRRDLRNGPFSELTYHNIRPLLTVKKLTVTADAGEESRIDSTWTFPDARSANQAQDSARLGLLMLKGSMNFLEMQAGKALGGQDKLEATKLPKLFDGLKNSLADASVKTEGATLKVGVKAKTDGDTIKAVMTEITPRIEAAANRAQSANNLKQLGIALHSYHDNMNMLPPVATQIGQQGKPSGLSWRVHLLPYIEQVNLYRQFKLDDAWDSEINKKLIPMMPKTYAAPGKKTKEPGLTFYQAFTTPIGEPLRSVFALVPNARLRLFNIPDGTSNTFAFAEAAEPVVWTKPDDIFIDFKAKILPKLGGVFEDGFHAAFCDGSVRFLSKKAATEELLKAAITTNGGEVTNWPDDVGDDEDRPARYRDKDKAIKTRPIDRFEEKKDAPIERKGPAPFEEKK